VVALLVMAPAPATAQWLALDVPPRPEPGAALAEAGQEVYDTHCWYCHGDDGDGQGPIARYLWPRPRDFTIASFKLRTTPSGELPTDEDLYRTITLGVPGTAMPAWRSVLGAEERWQVIAYLKTFADGMFEDEAFDPYETVIDVGERPRGPVESLIEAGRAVFETSDCWECHGAAGRGDGPKADALKDDWDYPMWATDLELGWKFRGGSTPRDTYMRLSTGLDGTPMPSYAESLTEAERWQVAYYVASLETRGARQAARSVVITALRVDGALPEHPAAEAWDAAATNWIPMTGQATYPPRWQTPAVTDIAVTAMYNTEEIALRIEWNDRVADSVPADGALAQLEGWTADESYPEMFPDGTRVRGRYRDMLEVMFPEADSGPMLPHFVYGDTRQAVTLWRWTADGASGTAAAPVEELRALGPDAMQLQPHERQWTTGRSHWADGRWTVVLRRPLAAGTSLRQGGLVPVAFHVREGSHGETGLRMSLSSWYYLHLREPAGASEALLVILAMVGTGMAEYGVVRLLRRRARAGRLRTIGIGW
jgi:mono/diheme cytochrome c family protein